MLDLANISVPLDAWAPGADTERFLKRAAARALGLKPADIASVELRRRGIDARKKRDVHFVATLAVALESPALEEDLLARAADPRSRKMPAIKRHVAYEPLQPPRWPEGALRPVVVGTGPAGLFAALYLAKAGARPLVLERGRSVEERQRDVAAFEAGGVLDPSSNVQFGEGGAGTFSDGKLSTNTKNPRIAHVLHWFAEAGAPQEILWEAHPHIGSDKLPAVVRAMREQIRQLGGEVRFGCRLSDIRMEDGRVSEVVVDAPGHPEGEAIAVSALVLATGHSARDTFEMLLERGFAMEPKPFSVGVRIEHSQQAINRSQWGEAAGHPALGAAEYKLVEHLKGGDPRNVYSFCMCPGGTVVCAASEDGGVVVNGMSNHARDGANANAALLVGVEPEDFDDGTPLGGMRFQRKIEQAAFELACAQGGSAFQAPCQRVGDFLGLPDSTPASVRERGSAPEVFPTYARGVVMADLHECLPDFVSQALEQAILLLDRKLRGFADPKALLTAPETRSSSPVRIHRGDDYQAFWRPAIIGPNQPGATGVYPCGEGPGYAGGIMSAAVDGLRVAEAMVAQARQES